MSTLKKDGVRRKREAELWAFRRKPADILSAKYVYLLHKRMLENVWRWAGEFLRTEKNIDVEPWLIEFSLKNILEGVRFWIDEKVYPADEIAARYSSFSKLSGILFC